MKRGLAPDADHSPPCLLTPDYPLRSALTAATAFQYFVQNRTVCALAIRPRATEFTKACKEATK